MAVIDANRLYWVALAPLPWALMAYAHTTTLNLPYLTPNPFKGTLYIPLKDTILPIKGSLSPFTGTPFPRLQGTPSFGDTTLEYPKSWDASHNDTKRRPSKWDLNIGPQNQA